MAVLVTGVAGFIGCHVARTLLDQARPVIGLDNLNDYYDVGLKRARLAQLEGAPGFTFMEGDLADQALVEGIGRDRGDLTHIVHLAAQAGVRHSLTHPRDYLRANIDGQLNILELARALGDRLRHLVYASSSSVYGGNTKVPFSIDDRTDRPLSLYAATKRADELMAYTYSHLYRIPATGLRFFTVYGPWGRPDMAAYIFTRKIFAGETLPVFNNGKSRRDFTYVDDVVAGILAATDRPPAEDQTGVPHKLYNLGNNKSERLLDYIQAIEAAVGRKAKLDFLPLQPGDVPQTYADIETSRRDLGYNPRTTIAEGIPRFVDWYRQYHHL